MITHSAIYAKYIVYILNQAQNYNKASVIGLYIVCVLNHIPPVIIE